MESELQNKKETTKLNKKNASLIRLLIIILVIILAFASFSTTFRIWDGLYPSGEYHLKIENKKGETIKEATLSVFHGGTKDDAFNYPFDNYLAGQDITSNEQGVIIVWHKPVGLEFGGSCWNLFWLLPICSGGPNYDFQISADGYKTVKYSVQEIFDLAYSTEEKGSASVLFENGEKVELPIYETTITLENIK